MNPTNQNQPAQTDQEGNPVNNPLAAMRKNEVTICQIRRHPIGLIGVHIMAGLMLLALAAVIFGVLPHVLTDVATSRLLAVGTLVFVLAAALVFGFLAISHKIYWGNSWILTSDSLTQVTQASLFDRQSSQLSLGNLEDVTAEQNGVLAHMFNFGVLRVETAGERSKFVFRYCPNPNLYAQKVLEAREEFEQGKQEAPQQQPQQPQPQAAPAQYQAPTPNPMPPTYQAPDPTAAPNPNQQQ